MLLAKLYKYFSIRFCFLGYTPSSMKLYNMKFGSLGLEHCTSLEDKLLSITSLIHTSIHDTGYVQHEFFNYRYNNVPQHTNVDVPNKLFSNFMFAYLISLGEIEMWLHDSMHSTIMLFPIAATWIIQNEIVTTSFQD